MLRRKAHTGAIIGAVSLLEFLFFLPRAASCRKLAPLRSTLAVIIGQHRPLAVGIVGVAAVPHFGATRFVAGPPIIVLLVPPPLVVA